MDKKLNKKILKNLLLVLFAGVFLSSCQFGLNQKQSDEFAVLKFKLHIPENNSRVADTFNMPTQRNIEDIQRIKFSLYGVSSNGTVEEEPYISEEYIPSEDETAVAQFENAEFRIRYDAFNEYNFEVVAVFEDGIEYANSREVSYRWEVRYNHDLEREIILSPKEFKAYVDFNITMEEGKTLSVKMFDKETGSFIDCELENNRLVLDLPDHENLKIGHRQRTSDNNGHFNKCYVDKVISLSDGENTRYIYVIAYEGLSTPVTVDFTEPEELNKNYVVKIKYNVPEDGEENFNNKEKNKDYELIITEGSTVEKPESANIGYHYKGSPRWYTQPVTDENYVDVEEYDFNMPVTGAMNLYGYWPHITESFEVENRNGFGLSENFEDFTWVATADGTTNEDKKESTRPRLVSGEGISQLGSDYIVEFDVTNLFGNMSVGISNSPYQSSSRLYRYYNFTEDTVVTFYMKADVASDLEFSIAKEAWIGYNWDKKDEILFTGSCDWTKYSYIIPEGLWRFSWGVNSAYTLREGTIYLDGLTLSHRPEEVTVDEFEDGNGFGNGIALDKSWTWKGNGNINIGSGVPQLVPGAGMDEDPNKSALKFDLYSLNGSYGNYFGSTTRGYRATVERNFNTDTEKELSFYVKNHIVSDAQIKVYLDYTTIYDGTDDISENPEWKKVSHIVSEGEHTIKFEMTKIYEDSSGQILLKHEQAIAYFDKLTLSEPVYDSSLTNGFGISENFEPGWKTEGTEKPTLVAGAGIDGDAEKYAVKFDYKNLYTNTSSLKRTVELTEEKVLSFAVKTDIYEPYDGVLEFYVDDEKLDSFTGPNGSWTPCSYELSAGTHILEWRAVGSSSGSTGGITNSVYLDGLKLENLAPIDNTLSNGFGNSETFERGWQTEGSPKPTLVAGAGIDGDAEKYAVKFDYKTLRTNTSSLKRTVELTEGKMISFAVKTDIYEQYDGVLEFYVDDEKLDSFTGMNGSWIPCSYELPEGEHVLEWRAVGSSSSSTTGITNSVYLDGLKLENLAPIDNTLSNGFGNSETFERGWQTEGNPKPTLVAGAGQDADEEKYAVKFDYTTLRTNTSSLKRTVELTEDKLLSFAVKTDINEQYDGVLEFYIDDIKMDSFTGTKGDWSTYYYDLESGEHHFEWRAVGSNAGYTSDITNSVYLDALTLSEAVVYPETLSENFENTLTAGIWAGNGVLSKTISNDPIFASWEQYGDALIDTHDKVYQIASYNSERESRGTSTLKLVVNPTVESSLSFDYKPDLWTSNKFIVTVDGEEEFNTTGNLSDWIKKAIIIQPGKHTIIFSVNTPDNLISPGLTNSVFLDNISLISNEMDKVDIYPKKLQESYIGGNTIEFSAKALRSDGSVMEGKTPIWTATGGTIDENGVFTPGNEKGTYTVTATIDGETASNTTVVIHGANYKNESYTIGNVTYKGFVSSTGTAIANTNYVSFDTSEGGTPAYKKITADGFFILKGTVKEGKYAVVETSKTFDDGSTHYTMNVLEGNFYERIWLRFGPGDYSVKIYDADISFNNTGDPRYEGDLAGSWGSSYKDEYEDTNRILTVTNTAKTPYETAMWTMPSYYCQSDNYIVSNAANAILGELDEDASDGEKLRAMHDWIVHRNHYDFVSFNYTNQRKKQDAVSVINYRMSVCEGYANTLIALTRYAGFVSKYIASNTMNHGWLQVMYKNEWKLLDATWDEGSSDQGGNGSSQLENTDKCPNSENYKYFLVGLYGVDRDHHSYKDDFEDYQYTARTATMEIVNKNRLPGVY